MPPNTIGWTMKSLLMTLLLPLLAGFAAAGAESQMEPIPPRSAEALGSLRIDPGAACLRKPDSEVTSPFKGLALDTAVWQFRADVTSKNARAFLWIPPKAETLRGVVIGQFNMCERPVLENPNFRAHLETINWGTVWIDTGFMGP